MMVLATDGSVNPNPGKGGYAVVNGSRDLVCWGQDSHTTNIRMEGEAICAAMTLAGHQPATIYTDSEFWCKVLTDWGSKWQKKNWHTSSGLVKNLDLVQQAMRLYAGSNIKLLWVRGHGDNALNIAADNFANMAREGSLPIELERKN